jgi:myo-inositol-1(or 4)-monophosphatase
MPSPDPRPRSDPRRRADGDVDLDALAELALATARDAAALAVELRGGPLDIATKTSRTDLVTSADRAVEVLIVERLSTARPGDGFLAEEGSGTAATHEGGVVWVVDPIDGTTNFVYDHPGWAVSIAARLGGVEGDDVVGVVVDPRHGDELVGIAGGGATRNGHPMRIPSPPSLAEALVATGFGYDPTRRAAQANVLLGVLPNVRDLRRMGAASVDLCSVGMGRVDAYFELGLAPWDLAAGVLVAREAGARVGDLRGGPAMAGGLVVAAHPDLWDPLAAVLRDAGA